MATVVATASDTVSTSVETASIVPDTVSDISDTVSDISDTVAVTDSTVSSAISKRAFVALALFICLAVFLPPGVSPREKRQTQQAGNGRREREGGGEMVSRSLPGGK